MGYAAECRKVVVALAVTACGFDSGGVGDGSTGGSIGDTGTSTTNPSTTNPSTTVTSTDPATTDPATTDPATTDPATTDPATTDPATTDPATTDPTETDPTETESATTDATTGDDATEGETDPSKGTSGGDDDAYGPCDGNTCRDDQMCSVVVDDNQTVLGNSCRVPCDVADDCPAPPDGDPEVLCPAPGYPWCVLACEFGACPAGMTCYPTQFGALCYWPI